jgi:hypothetical protein
LRLQDYWDMLLFREDTNQGVNPRLPPTFSVVSSVFAKASSDDRSTGSKQTLNGLFLFITEPRFSRFQMIIMKSIPVDPELLYFFSEVGR